MKMRRTLSEYRGLGRGNLHKGPLDLSNNHRFACANRYLGRLAAQEAGVWNTFPSRPSSRMRTLVEDQDAAGGGDSEPTCPWFCRLSLDTIDE